MRWSGQCGRRPRVPEIALVMWSDVQWSPRGSGRSPSTQPRAISGILGRLPLPRPHHDVARVLSGNLGTLGHSRALSGALGHSREPVSRLRRTRRQEETAVRRKCGLRAGALTQYIVLRGSMNSERPPESASSTPTGPGGSEGLREGLDYFLFESRRPFEHITCVPRARPQQGQHASPAGRSHRRPRRRQGGKGWQGRRQGRWQGLWPCGAPDRVARHKDPRNCDSPLSSRCDSV